MTTLIHFWEVVKPRHATFACQCEIKSPRLKTRITNANVITEEWKWGQTNCSISSLQKSQRAGASRSRGLSGSLGNNLLRQFFAFACSSYPCSGFPETAGVLTTHRPVGSRNSSPMTKPSLCDWQYATRAFARKSPGRDAISNISLGRQRRVLMTRAPRELTFSVNAVSTPGACLCPEM